MALRVQNIERSFSFKKDNKEIDLPDPNPSMSPEEVLKFYSGTYPELNNGMIAGPEVKGSKASYSITTKAGKLG